MLAEAGTRKPENAVTNKRHMHEASGSHSTNHFVFHGSCGHSKLACQFCLESCLFTTYQPSIFGPLVCRISRSPSRSSSAITEQNGFSGLVIERCSRRFVGSQDRVQGYMADETGWSLHRGTRQMGPKRLCDV